MVIGRNRDMLLNGHIRIGSNFYEKLKTFKYEYEELHSLQLSPNIVRVIKYRNLRWVMLSGWKKLGALLKILTGKPKGKNHLG